MIRFLCRPLIFNYCSYLLYVKYRIRTSHATDECTHTILHPVMFNWDKWRSEADVTNSTVWLISVFWWMQLFLQLNSTLCCVTDWQSKHTAVGTDTDQIQSLWKELRTFLSQRCRVFYVSSHWTNPWYHRNVPEIHSTIQKKKVAVLYSFDGGYNTSLSSLHVSIHSY